MHRIADALIAATLLLATAAAALALRALVEYGAWTLARDAQADK